MNKVKANTNVGPENDVIMSIIRKIVDSGNNAEVKKTKDGSLAVMAVKKTIMTTHQ